MELHQLRYFLAVARTGNFSRAAKECHVSQPSLSQQIIKLEEELGGALFERQQKGAVLTPAGNLFAPYAARILGEVEEAARRVSDSRTGVKGRLSLGVLPTIAPYFLPRLLEVYTKRFPEVEVVVQEEITPRLVGAIQDGEMDIALLSLPIAGPSLESLSLFDEALYLVMPKGHPLATERRKLDLKDLSKEKFILMQEGHCLTDQALEFCHMKGDFQPTVSCRSGQIQTLLALVEAGLGVSIVPAMAVQPLKGVVYKAFDGARPTRKIGFIWKRNRFQSVAAERFLEGAKEVAETISNGTTPRL